jgi:hypothetical protein
VRTRDGDLTASYHFLRLETSGKGQFHCLKRVRTLENNKPSRPQGLSIGIGLVFGVVLYVLTNEAVWIGVGIALGAAREIRSRG